jgi:hypothetical protein
LNSKKSVVAVLIVVLISVLFLAQGACQESISRTVPNEQTIQVSVDGKNVLLAVAGNISAAQISDMSFMTLEDWYNNTDIDFTVTGLNGSAGFMNMTIPKNAILGGTEPTVAANGARPENPGFAQDGDNFYVWFTMLPQWDNSSRGYVAIHFLLVNSQKPIEPSTGPFTGFYILLGIAVAVIATALVLLVIRYKCRQVNAH